MSVRRIGSPCVYIRLEHTSRQAHTYNYRKAGREDIAVGAFIRIYIVLISRRPDFVISSMCLVSTLRIRLLYRGVR